MIRRCRNYYGIKFTRRLTEIKTPFIRDALVATYLGRFDEAVEIYLGNERFSSAIELRMKIGDLAEAEQLMREHGAEDELKQRLWNAMGEVHEDNQRWSEALYYYSQVSVPILRRDLNYCLYVVQERYETDGVLLCSWRCRRYERSDQIKSTKLSVIV